MNTQKHTPGPWLNAPRIATSYVHADGGEVAQLMSHRGIPDAEIEANARLIAASPDMYDALIPFVAAADAIPSDLPDDTLLFAHFPSMFGGQTELRVGDLRKTRAAIRKAEGGAS